MIRLIRNKIVTAMICVLFVYDRKSYLVCHEYYQSTTFDENEFDSHFGLPKEKGE